jgi:hypothetical protein
MKSLIRSIAGRKRAGHLSAFVHCAVTVVMLTGCAGQKEFQEGYERASGDTVKRQYWIQQNMQKAEQPISPYRLTLYRIPVVPDPDAKVKTVPYEIAFPIYE